MSQDDDANGLLEKEDHQGSADNDDWQIRIPDQAKVNDDRLSKVSAKLAKFYRHQNGIIDSFESADSVLRQDNDEIKKNEESAQTNRRRARCATTLSLVINVVLLIAKLMVAFTSGSLAVIASSIDSFFDLISGVVLFAMAKKMAKKNSYKYPIGKSRMEPVGILVFAVVMLMVSLQLTMEAIKRLLASAIDVEINTVDVILLSLVVVLKIGLYIFCNAIEGSATAEALAEDHKNDVLTNAIGFAAAYLATQYYWWIDPLGALLFSLFLIYNWWEMASETGNMMLGRSAPPEFLQSLTYVAFNHDKRVKEVDTVRAFRLGIGYIVEVDIVLPESMPLRETHDIGEALQCKLEKLDEVERAFVHIDFESDHNPAIEHRSDDV